MLAGSLFPRSQGRELLLDDDQAALSLGTKDKDVWGGVAGCLNFEGTALLAQDLCLGCEWLDLRVFGQRVWPGLCCKTM